MTIDIKALAKQAGGTAYVNRHYPGETAVAFGPVALAEFVRLVRESVLAEATEVCVTTADARATPYSDGYNMGAIDCTKAIRSLKK